LIGGNRLSWRWTRWGNRRTRLELCDPSLQRLYLPVEIKEAEHRQKAAARAAQQQHTEKN